MQHIEAFMGLGLKAQSQSRNNWEAQAEVNNPRQVAFVRQANIADNQQINNGDQTSGAGSNESPPINLLDTTHGERLDVGPQSKANGSDKALATVAQINGAAKL